ncbi:hypothetical protein EOM82_09490 [bacterium]|nr:hypothetical protein [bacterium]
MIVYMLLALAWSKIKGYKIKPVLKAYALYPYLAVELLYLFLQANIFMRNYAYIQYTPYLKSIHLYALILPMLYYKLYRPGLVGSGLIVIGTALNKFVMSQNGGKMPVFASLSKLTGYYSESAILTADSIHVAGNELTNYKFLSDIIDIGWSILSVGDLFIHAFTFIIVFYTVRECNIRQNKTEVLR